MVRNKHYRCSACESKAAVEWGQRNREKKRAQNAAFRKSALGKQASARATVLYRERHPEKQRAHQIVQNEIKQGRMKREQCSVCGTARAHAHHDDYSQPLAVVWLCHRHHMERHSMLAARAPATSEGEGK
jgi:hypothetical protein